MKDVIEGMTDQQLDEWATDVAEQVRQLAEQVDGFKAGLEVCRAEMDSCGRVIDLLLTEMRRR